MAWIVGMYENEWGFASRIKEDGKLARMFALVGELSVHLQLLQGLHYLLLDELLVGIPHR